MHLTNCFIRLRFVPFALAIFGCDIEEPAEPIVPVSLEPPASRLQSARALRVENRTYAAVTEYLQIDIGDDSAVLFERGEYLLQTGEFYRSLAELTFELRSELLQRWVTEWREGELDSDLTPAMAALDAAHGERWAECLELVRATRIEEIPAWIGARVLLAGALASRSLGDVVQEEVLLEELSRLSTAAAVDVCLVRSVALEAEPTGIGVDDLVALDDWRCNAALVNLAQGQLASDSPAAAFKTLQRHNFRLPVVTEPLNSGMMRKFMGGEAVEVLAEACYSLAHADLVRAGQLGEGSAFVALGVVELRRSEYSAATAAFEAALAAVGRSPLDSVTAEAGKAAAAILFRGDVEGATRQIALATGLGQAVRQAFLARELALGQRGDLAAQFIEPALATLLATRPRGGVDRVHRYFGALWVVEALYRSRIPEGDLVYDAINAAHDPNLGYSPRSLPGGHLLEVLRCYRAICDGMAEEILGQLVSHYDESVSAHSLLQYLNSNDGSGIVTQG